MAEIIRQHAYTVHHVGALPPHIDAGQHISDLFKSSGEYTTVLLKQGAEYVLQTPIWMQSNNQEIATEGYPTENERKARLYTRGEKESTAIAAKDRENIVIKCLYINGCREEMGWLEGGGAIIVIGGWLGKDPVLERCVLTHPRGWSCCHLVDGSQGGRICNNEIGPSGQPPPKGPWADGLSIACKDGLIANNTIIDATDGAIVVFCAPGTTVIGNTIIARTRNLLGGINLVDPFPFKADFTNTRILNNQIKSEGAFIHMAIGIGSTTWCNAHDIQNYGGIVKDNIIGPGRMGYGIAAAGCKDFTVLQNKISHSTQFCGSMREIPEVTPPCPFLRIDDGWATGTFQAEFVEGPVRYLIGVRDEKGQGVRYHADALRWQAGRGAECQSGIELEGVRFELNEEGRILAWDQHNRGRVLWASDHDSNTHSRRSSHLEPFLSLDRKSGALCVKSARDPAVVLWDPMQHLQDVGYETKSNDPVLHLHDSQPFVQVKDGGSTLYTTMPVWKHFDLVAGEFIAVGVQQEGGRPSSAEDVCSAPPPVPHASRPTSSLSEMLSQVHLPGHHHHTSQPTSPAPPPALPPRPGQSEAYRPSPPARGLTYLYMDPETSQLVLHTSRHPTRLEEDQVVWRSPNWKTCKSEAKEASKATLQGDGNFVIYGTGNGAVWASGTNGREKKVDNVAIVPAGRDGRGARFELRAGGEVAWSSRQ